MLLEACVTTAAQAVASVDGGADRLELCTRLEVGGLTPGPELLASVRQALSAAGYGPVPVFCMVRPIPGRFTAGPAVLDRMAGEARDLLNAGAAGLVMGLLDGDGGVDRRGVRTIVEAADGVPVTFHRAFDELADPLEALAVLRELGIQRVLTAGGPGTAWQGRETLRRLVAEAGARGPVILGAGGIRGPHAVELIRATGLAEIHARAEAFPDLSRSVRTGGPQA